MLVKNICLCEGHQSDIDSYSRMLLSPTLAPTPSATSVMDTWAIGPAEFEVIEDLFVDGKI